MKLEIIHEGFKFQDQHVQSVSNATSFLLVGICGIGKRFNISIPDDLTCRIHVTGCSVQYGSGVVRTRVSMQIHTVVGKAKNTIALFYFETVDDRVNYYFSFNAASEVSMHEIFEQAFQKHLLATLK